MKSVFEELAAGDMRDPPHYALEVVHSSVRFRFKRPAKRVKNINLKTIFTFTYRHLNYPCEPREPSEISELKANRSALSTCHMSAPQRQEYRG